MLISAEHLSINFGSRQLLDDVDFYLNEGDKTGVIGINGTGKSTFLKVLAGWLQPDSGTIARKPNLQVSVLAQNPDMHDDLTVLEQIFASMPPEFRQLNEYEAKRMLTRLGLADTNRLIGTLSGGERRRACGAVCLPGLAQAGKVHAGSPAGAELQTDDRPGRKPGRLCWEGKAGTEMDDPHESRVAIPPD